MSYFNYNNTLKKYLKHEFQNIDILDTSYSQMQQDMFVLSILNGKKNGVYVEVGSHDPIGVNNTYVLENKFNWKGISFEIDINMVNRFNQIRQNPCVGGDATNLDYTKIFEDYLETLDVDYLSVDIEPPDNTLKALKLIIEAGLRPSVITFEHEAMSGELGRQVRVQSREFLKSHGYTLFVKDVSNLGIGPNDKGYPYHVEDWWVLKERIDPDIFSKLQASDVEFIESRDTVYNLADYYKKPIAQEVSLISKGIGI